MTQLVKNRYTDVHNDANMQGKRQRQWEAAMHNDRLDGRKPPNLSMNILLTVRSSMKYGAAPGGDEFSVEMLKELPWTAMLGIQEAFQRRAL